MRFLILLLLLIISKVCFCADEYYEVSDVFLTECKLADIHQNTKIKINDDYYSTPLIYAVRHKNTDCIKKVYKKFSGINQVDETGSTALIHAAIEGKSDVVRYLIEHGADINIKNKLDFSYVDLRISSQFYEEINQSCNKKTLEKYTALTKKQLIGPIFSYSPMHMAVDQNNLDCVKTVYELFSGINDQDAYGYTPLMNASELGNKEIMNYLISKGADETIQNNKGNTYKDIYKIVKKEDYDYKEDMKNLVK